MSAVLSERFPTRGEVARAARVALMVERLQHAGQKVPAHLTMELQHAWATFQQLPQHEQGYVSHLFNQLKSQTVEQVYTAQQEQEAAATQQRTDTLVKELTRDLVPGQSKGLTAEIAAALRAGDRVNVRTKKLPTGEAADARVKAHTGQTLAQYEAKLDRALEARNMFRYNDEAKYKAFIEKNFPGQDFKAVDRVVRGWAAESAGLELQRRAQRDTPDTVTIRNTPESEMRLALLESIAEVEASNPKSPFLASQRDRLEQIVSERGNRTDDLRADIAQAFLTTGNGSLEVEVGATRDDTDEIVGIEENTDGN